MTWSPGDLNNDGRKDLVFLETAKNYLDLVIFDAHHKLVPANRWQVFEEHTFRGRRRRPARTARSAGGGRDRRQKERPDRARARPHPGLSAGVIPEDEIPSPGSNLGAPVSPPARWHMPAGTPALPGLFNSTAAGAGRKTLKERPSAVALPPVDGEIKVFGNLVVIRQQREIQPVAEDFSGEPKAGR